MLVAYEGAQPSPLAQVGRSGAVFEGALEYCSAFGVFAQHILHQTEFIFVVANAILNLYAHLRDTQEKHHEFVCGPRLLAVPPRMVFLTLSALYMKEFMNMSCLLTGDKRIADAQGRWVDCTSGWSFSLL